MSIVREIERIQTNVDNSLTAVAAYGVNINDGANSNDLPTLITGIADKVISKDGISLGIASDGLIYIFVDGTPVGTGIPQGQTADVYGYVDENNAIVLNGNLDNGIYTFKYEMDDGSLVNIGSLEINEEKPYINWIKEVGYVAGKRMSMTSGVEKDATDSYLTGFIPVKYGQTVRIKDIDVTENDNITIATFDINKQAIKGTSATYGTTLYRAFVEKGTESNGVYASTLTSAINTCFTTDLAYIRISSKSITDDSIITVDQEIEPEIADDPINILNTYTVNYNKRFSSSSAAYVDCAGMISIAVPISDVFDKVVKIKGFTVGLQASGGKSATWYVYDDTTLLSGIYSSDGSNNVWNSPLLTTNNGISSVPVNETTFKFTKQGTVLYINLAINSNGVSVTENDLTGKSITIEDNTATYINQISISTDASGNLYVGTNGEKGYKTGYTLSSSTGAEIAKSGYMVTGFIPATKRSVLCLKDVATASSSNYVVAYDINKNKITDHATATLTLNLLNEVPNNSGVYASTIFGSYGALAYDSIAYIRIASSDINANSIATIDQAIREGREASAS